MCVYCRYARYIYTYPYYIANFPLAIHTSIAHGANSLNHNRTIAVNVLSPFPGVLVYVNVIDLPV